MDASFVPDIEATKRVLSLIDSRPEVLHEDEFDFLRAFVRQHAVDLTPASRDETIENETSSSSSQSDDEAPPPSLLDPAILQLTKEIEDCPSCRAYVKRGLLSLDENAQAASDDASEALKLNPDSAAALRLRARARHVLHDHQGAYRDMSEAQMIDYNEDYDELHAQMKVNSAVLAKEKEERPNEPSADKTFDFSVFLNNPEFMHMAQSMMNNPQFMNGVFANMPKSG